MQNRTSLRTRVLTVCGDAPPAEAVTLLRSGQLVAFPTDTVYGLGCDLWQEQAIARLYEAKGRPSSLAIPVLVASAEDVALVALDPPAGYAALAERFWPGALTLVLRRQARVPSRLCAGNDTIAVRMPDQALVRGLAAALGGAMATTSANLSGRPASCTAAEALADLDGRIPLLLDGGRSPGGQASSIVDLVNDPPLLLREGALTLAMLRTVLPTLELAPARGAGG